MHPFTRAILNSPPGQAISNNPFTLVPIGTVAGAGLVGSADLFIGEDTGLNSGEFLTNGLVSTVIPIAGAVTGSTIGLGGYSTRKFMADKKGLRNPPPNNAVVDMTRADGVYRSVGNSYTEDRPKTLKEIGEYLKGTANSSVNGAAIGSLIAGLPVTRYMAEDWKDETGDKQTVGSLKEALSENDLRILNALLEANSGQNI